MTSVGKRPVVSIVMPLFNARPWLEETLASVQAQTLGDWELIVVDDGSSDDGPALVQGAAGRDPRIRLIRQSNAGPAAARNRGARKARGAWIAFLDSDDLLPPDRLASDWAALSEHPGSRAVAGSTEWFGEDGRVLHTCLLDGDVEVNRWRHAFYSVFYFCALLVHREAFQGCGAFSEDRSVSHAEDYDFTLRLLDREEVAQRGGVAVRIRRHAANRSVLAGEKVIAQSVEVVRRRWNERLPEKVSTETMTRLFRFWRMEPAVFALEEFQQLIAGHGAFAAAHVRRRPAAERAVRLEWERRLAWRIAEARPPKRQVVALARLEGRHRGGLAAARLMLRWSRLRRPLTASAKTP